MITYISISRSFLLTLLGVLFLPSCSEQFLDQEEAAARVPRFAEIAKTTIQGYFNPFEEDMEAEKQGNGPAWKTSSAAASVEVAMDWNNRLLMFRSPRNIQLLSVWDDKDHCFPADGQPKTSREYDYWVLEVGLRPEFLSCITKHQQGIHYRLQVQ